MSTETCPLCRRRRGRVERWTNPKAAGFEDREPYPYKLCVPCHLRDRWDGALERLTEAWSNRVARRH